jgi:aldose 1-epimerase
VAGDALRLHLTSQDGDQGYPGTLQVTVTFQFSEDGTLSIHYLGTTDRDTVVNLTNHSYFDLSAGAAPLAQRLQLTARYYTENDENTLPTGVIAPVAGTPFDFTQEKSLGRDIEEDHPQLLRCRGYDHNFVLENDGTLQPFGTLWSPETGIALEASTDMPGVQLYTGNFVEEPQGKAGRHYVPRDGVCLETQFFPNAMGVRDFQKPILRAGDTYDHRTTYRFFIR